MKNQHSAIRMHYFFDVYAKINCSKNLLGHFNKIIKCHSSHYRAGRLISNAHQKSPAPPHLRSQHNI